MAFDEVWFVIIYFYIAECKITKTRILIVRDETITSIGLWERLEEVSNNISYALNNFAEVEKQKQSEKQISDF